MGFINDSINTVEIQICKTIKTMCTSNAGTQLLVGIYPWISHKHIIFTIAKTEPLLSITH
jgi:hypothetical protein